MSGEDERLFGLMEIAERQQAQVEAALAALATERDKLAQEREALAQQIAILEQRTKQAVTGAVAAGFAEVGKTGVEAVTAATAPLVQTLEQVTEDAKAVDTALQRIARWASWRLLGWLAAAVLVVALAAWLSSTGIIWVDGQRIATLEDRIAQLRANRDSWVKAGMQSRLTYCDPGNRPCVAVDESAGQFGPPGGPYDLRVLKGY